MDKSVEKTALDVGVGMLEAGAEIFRVEDTVNRILASHGIENASVFCISSFIIISDKNGTFTRRIKKCVIDLSKIDYYNSLSREICNNRALVKESRGYPLFIQYVCVIIATGSFCLYFGGNALDALISGIIGILINFRKMKIRFSFSNVFFDSLLSGLLAGGAGLFIPIIHYDKVIIGTIMLLVPGLTVTSAIRDIMLSDILTGMIELFDAIFTAISISLGCACSLAVIKWLSLFFA